MHVIIWIVLDGTALVLPISLHYKLKAYVKFQLPMQNYVQTLQPRTAAFANYIIFPSQGAIHSS